MLIAELSCCHLGNLETAKEMIRVAHECGATHVKAQAFKAADIKSGSMSRKFYEQCEFTFDQYTELIDYADLTGLDMFYSIFSQDYALLLNKQKWVKLTAHQTETKDAPFPWRDKPNVLVSIERQTLLPKLSLAKPMLASTQLALAVDLSYLVYMKGFYGRVSGYSDHTVGISKCVEAANWYCADVIEKHFTLDKNIKFEGKIYRDSIHGATPNEFEILAMKIGG